MRTTLILITACLLSSCSFITVKGASSQQSFVHFGPVELKTDVPSRAVVISTVGIGATSVQGSNNVGYLNHEVVIIPYPASCNLILIVRDHRQVENIKKALGETIKSVCSNDMEAKP